MQISLNHLRRVIREEVNRARRSRPLRESTQGSWNEYRRTVADAMREAGINEDIVDEVSDLGYMAGDLVQRLHDVWQTTSDDMAREDFADDTASAVVGHMLRRRDVTDAESFRQPLIDALS